MADTFIEFARMCAELRTIIREEMVEMSADLRKQHADLCKDVRQELLSTWNEICAKKLEIPKHIEEIFHLHADLHNLRADLCRDVRQELQKAKHTSAFCKQSTNFLDIGESDPFKTTAYKELRIPKGQVKDPNGVTSKLTEWQQIDLNDGLPKEQLQPLALSQETESADSATLPGQLDDENSISPPLCSPPEMTLSSGDNQMKTTSSKRFRQKRARKPRLQNAMGLVPDIDQERINREGISKKIEDILRNSWFEYLSMSAVFANAVCIGLACNFRATHLTEDTPAIYRSVDVIVFLYFCTEVVMKLIAYRRQFFSVFGWAWNAFDLVLVILQFAEEVMALLRLGVQRANASHLIRMCRILRALRCIRIMKLTLFTGEFRLLISCVMHCLASFLWASLFLSLVIFIKAVYVTDSVVSHRIECYQTGADDEGLAKYYGSVPQACLSLFQALTGGVDWNELLLPLKHSPWNVFLFLMYVSFGLLALMNLVTGLFVNTAIERAQAVKDLTQLFEGRQLFNALDIDASDCITMEELLSHMNSTAVQDFLSRLDMENDDLRVLFDIIDRDGGGTIDFEEFVNGLIHLTGTARSVDLLIMNHELRSYFRRTTNETGEIAWEPRWSKVGWPSQSNEQIM